MPSRTISRIIATMIEVFPVPGPPEITVRPARAAAATAWRCSSDIAIARPSTITGRENTSSSATLSSIESE